MLIEAGRILLFTMAMDDQKLLDEIRKIVSAEVQSAVAAEVKAVVATDVKTIITNEVKAIVAAEVRPVASALTSLTRQVDRIEQRLIDVEKHTSLIPGIAEAVGAHSRFG